MWDPDPNNATRLLVRARVASLQEVPQFIVLSMAEGFQGVSWTVQCDIVQQFMLGAQPQDEDPVPPYPHDGHQLPVEFFGMGQPVANFQFDLNIPPMEGNNVEEDVAINDDEGWDPWPVQHTQPPEPVANANNANIAINAEEQFSYQLLGLEDLPSDDLVGYFNDIIIPQGVQFQQEEASVPAEAVLALPAFPPENMILEGNNDQGEDDMQIEENINVGLMLHLEQSNPDPAFEDYMARKCSSSWADLFPDNVGSVSVPKVWAAFFMGLLIRPDSFDWARKFLLSGAISAFVKPSMDTISIKIPSKCLLPPSQDTHVEPQSPPPTKAALRKRQPILVDTAVRRSARLRAKAKGFKNCTGIGKKNCSCCAQCTPPSLQHDIIKKLGTEFCKVDPSKLNLDDLSRSKSTGIAIQRPVAPPSSKDDEPGSSENQAVDPLFDDDDAESSASAGL
jgi:hypothetical protein